MIGVLDTGSRGGCRIIISNTVPYDDKVKIESNLSNIEAEWIKNSNSYMWILSF